MGLPPLDTGRTEEAAVAEAALASPRSPTRSDLAELLRAQAGTSAVDAGMRKMEYSSTGSLSAYVASQSHLLKATHDNPLPTAVPPPIAAVAGLLGVRHVLCLIGLPERGKPFIAHRLSKYLSFFHGAEVKLFDINEVMSRAGGPAGSDLNATFMFDEIKTFMNATSSSADRNMSVPKCSRSRAGTAELQAAVGAPLGTGADEKPASRPEEEARIVEELLVEANDKRRKNVDSGKVKSTHPTPYSSTPRLTLYSRPSASIPSLTPSPTPYPHPVDIGKVQETRQRIPHAQPAPTRHPNFTSPHPLLQHSAPIPAPIPPPPHIPTRCRLPSCTRVTR
jgi:hypothetical protein